MVATTKFYSLNETKKVLERYCIYQERCHQEIERKLYTLHVIDAIKEEVILHLLAHDFLNEERFSKAYARGKFRIKKWGKNRIVRELKFRNISDYNIKSALSEIDPDEYLDTFNALSQKRYLQINESNSYKKRKKIADYLLYRGWESDLVYRKVLELVP